MQSDSRNVMERSDTAAELLFPVGCAAWTDRLGQLLSEFMGENA